MNNTLNCADTLEGKLLNDKWQVVQKLEKEPGETGGNFSIGYIVKDMQGNKAFLKAVDFYKVLSTSNNVMEDLNALTNAYDFEVKLLQKCVGSKLRYVVKLLDYNQYKEEGFVYPVPYMVFECAETSARKFLDISRKIDFAWSLRSLHNIAVSLNELHTVNIAHQDVKPSNVMLFNNQSISKIGDVGRSSMLGEKIKHDNLNVAGDLTYSPLEQLYGWIDNDWQIRRYSCDMYMLGNLIYTYFNGMSINISIINRLKNEYRPKSCNGLFQGTYGDILPLLISVFNLALENFNSNVPENLRNELILLIKQLCHPDYKNQRGDLKRNGSQRYSMERFISKLDLLCIRYEYELKKGLTE